MYSLTYVSSAIGPFSSDDLRKLLTRSRLHNERAGITGMLLYKGGNFMQVLEGEPQVVRATQAKIQADARHKGVLVLLQGGVPVRNFGSWSMAFRDLNAPSAAETPGYDDFLNTPLNDPRFARDPQASQKLLQVFKTNM
jgi:hypothetical protein